METCYDETFHVIIYMIKSPVACDLMHSRALSFTVDQHETLSSFHQCIRHSFTSGIFYLRFLLCRSLSSLFGHYNLLLSLCFIASDSVVC